MSFSKLMHSDEKQLQTVSIQDDSTKPPLPAAVATTIGRRAIARGQRKLLTQPLLFQVPYVTSCSIPPLSSAKLIDVCMGLMRDCYSHIKTHPTEPFETALAQSEVIWTHWLYHFDTFNTEQDTTGISLTDTLFVTLCYATAAYDPRARAKAESDDFYYLYHQIRILGCRHTSAVQYEHPLNYQSIRHLFAHISAYVFKFLRDPYTSNDTPESIAVATEVAHKLVIPCHSRAVDTNRFEQTLKSLVLLASEIKEEEDKKITKLGIRSLLTEVDDIDESSRGFFWTKEPLKQLQSFIPLCSRILRCLFLDACIVMDGPTIKVTELEIGMTGGAVSKGTMAALTNWIHETCQFEPSNEFDIDMRQRAFETLAPLGSRSHATRKRHTRNEVDPPQTVLEKQLGVDTATALVEMAEIDIKVIIDNPTHIMHDALVISMIEYLFKQDYEMSFTDRYVLMTERIQKEHLNGLNQVTSRRTMAPPSPVIIQACKSWYVLDTSSKQLPLTAGHGHGEFRKVGSFIEAVGQWLLLIHTKHNQQLEDGRKIHKWCDRFIASV